MKSKKIVFLLLQPHRPWLCACVFTRLFLPVACKLVARVVARRDARVRDQQHGRAVRGQRPLGEKKVFFGDFLSPDKKLPAPWSGSSGSKTSTSEAKSLDSRLRGNDERRVGAPPSPQPSPASGRGRKI